MIVARLRFSIVLVALSSGTTSLIACEKYDANDLEILTAYSAKQTCSCIFVMKRSEDFCNKWSKEQPNVKSISIDYDSKSVESQALNLWGARAHFVDQRRGCVLDPRE